MVTPSADKTAKVWELFTGRLLFSLEGHTKQVSFAKFTKDNRNIVTAGDNRVIIWDGKTGKEKFFQSTNSLIQKKFTPGFLKTSQVETSP